MLVTIYQGQWFADADAGTVRIDSTRMAQGVMIGIGFLGSGRRHRRRSRSEI